MAELTIIGGPTPPKGETLHERTMAVFTVYGGYADGIKVYPQTHVAAYDLSTASWKPRGAANGTPMTIPGATNGQPKPPLTEITEVQAYTSGRESQTTTRKQLIITTNQAGTQWNYAAPPLDIAVVAPHDANYYQFLQNELSSTIAGVQGATQDAQAGAADAYAAAQEARDAIEDIAGQDAVNAEAFNRIRALEGRADISQSRLRELAYSRAWVTQWPRTYENDVLTSANVRWMDYSGAVNSKGSITRVWNHDLGVVISWKIYHQASDRTIEQPEMTFNADGQLTNQPLPVIVTGNTTGVPVV